MSQENVDEQLAAIGQFVVAFSTLEKNIEMLIGKFLGVNFYAIDAITYKLMLGQLIEILQNLYGAITPSTEEDKNKTTWEDFFGKCRNINDIRNNLMHGLWVFNIKNANEVSNLSLIKARPKGGGTYASQPYEYQSKEEIDRETAKVNELIRISIEKLLPDTLKWLNQFTDPYNNHKS